MLSTLILFELIKILFLIRTWKIVVTNYILTLALSRSFNTMNAQRNCLVLWTFWNILFPLTVYKKFNCQISSLKHHLIRLFVVSIKLQKHWRSDFCVQLNGCFEDFLFLNVLQSEKLEKRNNGDGNWRRSFINLGYMLYPRPLIAMWVVLCVRYPFQSTSTKNYKCS